MKILYVDDDDLICQILSDVLREFGHEVVCAKNGVEALVRLAEQADIEIVFSDIDMPNKDGIGLLQAIQESHPDKPVVLMVELGEGHRAGSGSCGGVSGFLQKPLKIRELMEFIGQGQPASRQERLEPTHFAKKSWEK